MTKIFISHSSKDKHFADFLVRIFEYHHIQCWYDSSNIELGKKFKEEIALGLQKADFLIVLVSENTSSSKWVAREISEYCAINTNPRVIPILIEETNLNEIYDGLNEYQSIYLYKNMLDGFTQLFNIFKMEFLPVKDRRKGIDRRETTDRRTSSPIARLRFGMWKNYETIARKGKFDPVEYSTHMVLDIVEIFMKPDSELFKYDFFNKSTGEKKTITEADFTEIVYSIYERNQNAHHFVQVLWIEQIAEELSKIYDVKPKDRRSNIERRI